MTGPNDDRVELGPVEEGNPDGFKVPYKEMAKNGKP
jgi:hypothetical protein